MAELSTDCCTPAVQATCCEPDDKAVCCAPGHPDGCGCAAGNMESRTAAGAAEDVRETVRAKYAAAAHAAATGAACCSPGDEEGGFGASLYARSGESDAPQAALGASLGCGVPTAVAALHAGEVVLDLGSGAGTDVLISARRVGSTGRAIGIDMTDEMLDLPAATPPRRESRTSSSARATSKSCRWMTATST